MYCTTHALVGGFTAGSGAGLVTAFLGGLVSHLILDVVPHHDYYEAKWGVLDFLTAVSLVLFCREKFVGLPYFLPGAIGGALPDLEVALSHVTGKRWLIFPSHTGLTPHHRMEWPWGFFVQAFVVVVAFLYYIWLAG
ncbi:MAG TPA: hypothetical protein GXZ36_11120 [Firmicutes bacterium]|jgi:hypothetical protein|nr:hypothetical protein [Bacillota bacterium]